MQQHFSKQKNPNAEYIKDFNESLNKSLDDYMTKNKDYFVDMFKKEGCSEDQINTILRDIRHEAQLKMIKTFKEKMREKLLEQKAKLSLSKK